MKRFKNLLQKEVKELVTKQLVISLAFTVLLFNAIGQISKKEVQKAVGIQTISVLDQDGSEGSRALLKGLESARFKIVDQTGKGKDEALASAKAGESKLLLVVPAGFGDSLAELKPSEIETYSFMRSFSLIGARGQVVVQSVISALNETLSNDFLAAKLPGADPVSLKRPIKSRDFVVVRDRTAEESAGDRRNAFPQQSMLIPIVLMMIVICSSQMVISAVAMEKQNKTWNNHGGAHQADLRITAKVFVDSSAGGEVYMFTSRACISGMGEEIRRGQERGQAEPP